MKPVPLMAASPAIQIASNTFHPRRARQILCDESPELAGRLVPIEGFLADGVGPLHAVLVAFEGYRVRRSRTGRMTLAS